MPFIAELKRRNVFRVGVAYAIVAWLLIEVAHITSPTLQLPDWTTTLVTVLLIVGFPVAVLTPDCDISEMGNHSKSVARREEFAGELCSRCASPAKLAREEESQPE